MPKDIRPIRIDGNIAYVPLTRGYEAVIDAVDVTIVEGFRWYAMPDKNTVYAATTTYDGGKKKTVRMHRLLMSVPSEIFVDHRDTDGLNNRKKNLRKATVTQNNQNRNSRKNTSSLLKGVSWHKTDKRWQARIKINGTERHLGRYPTAEAAHAAYCEASAKYHGEFGRTE